MKRTIKKLIRPFWRLSAPARRPLIRKFDHHMMRLLGSLPRPVEAAAAPPAAPPADLDLVLNSLVREMVRLQVQVEVLQQQIEDLRSDDRAGAHLEGRLSVVGEIG